MSNLVARTGRHQQRYENGCRLIAGCIPYRYGTSVEDGDGTPKNVVQVLMINSASGPGLLFPKGGWENDETMEEAALREALEEAGVRGDKKHFLGDYHFKSKSLQDEFTPEGLCKAAMFALFVTEELQSWPEESTRQRSWLNTSDALQCCRHPWMKDALLAFIEWHANQIPENSSSEQD
ncbi:nudix hydrolase 16, mitochondrial-like [Rutidosis leptorrhynchoides]|uniref:nudix hydrolase 16, mitochondrial-like n=1 Tax=Rutidosis leptorrhynchoides TaxID=125765 RepID=UPI003A99BE45